MNPDALYALLAVDVYHEGRDTANRLEALPGVTCLVRALDPDSGFEAAAQQCNGEIIISYAGTLLDGLATLPMALPICGSRWRQLRATDVRGQLL